MTEPHDLSPKKRPAAIAQRQRDTLERYLRRDHWSAKQALVIMAGLDPERYQEAHGSQRYRSFLPRGFQRKWRNHDGSVSWENVEIEVTDILRSLQGIFTGHDRSPLGWAQIAQRSGHTPAWASSLRRSSCEFAVILSTLRGTVEAPANQKPKDPAKVAAGKKRQATGELNKVRRLILKEWDEGGHSNPDFEHEMAVKYRSPPLRSDSPEAKARRSSQLPMASEREIRKWIAKVQAPPGSEAHAEVKSFRELGVLP
ncbi:hypothetical protein [Devosia sp. 1635]|uniref:hypothetical protein n=1 Tax=Devosia sp. 1635 TaxID=2726066 RepID=UPI0015652E14|nr:hypothetical protein [Devosia sp. 1635]